MYCGVLAYADDFTLLSYSTGDLQCMLEICFANTNDWHYTFGTSKPSVIVLGESAISRDVEVRIIWSVSESSIDTSAVMSSAWSAFYALKSGGPWFGSLITPHHFSLVI